MEAEPTLSRTELAAEPAREYCEPSEYGPSIIGMTVVMRGELTFAEDLTIEGTFDGPCTAGIGTVLLRRTACLHGEITAERLCVEQGTNLENAVLSGRITCAK